MEIEEFCLCCGRAVDQRAYCSDECEALDAGSPSISSASSCLSSPQNDSYRSGIPDVPPLPTSALGYKLSSHRAQSRYASSSSASSSTAWSLATSDEEDDPALVGPLYDDDNPPDVYLKMASAKDFASTSDLVYVRRPSNVNHRTTAPRAAQQAQAAMSPTRSVSRSVPSSKGPAALSGHRSSTDEEYDCRPPSLAPVPVRPRVRRIQSNTTAGAASPPVSRSQPKRNRTSLPASFALLNIGSPTALPSRSQPTAAAVPSQSLSKGSPSSFSTATGSTPTLAQSVSTLRGPPREDEPSKASARRPSRSPASVHDRSERASASAAGVKRLTVDEERRGRRRSHELDGPERGPSLARHDAPGLGNGRSGLRGRGQRV